MVVSTKVKCSKMGFLNFAEACPMINFGNLCWRCLNVVAFCSLDFQKKVMVLSIVFHDIGQLGFFNNIVIYTSFL